MVWVAAVAVLLCGCGKILIDPGRGDATTGSGDDAGGDDATTIVDVLGGADATDAPAGHDEDNDGIADSADVCPHTPDVAQLDNDGDKVGDVCDVQPTMPNQTWLFFAPMVNSDVFAGTPTQWTKLGDSWRCPASGPVSLLRVPMPVTNVDIWIGFDVVSVGAGDRQISLIVRNVASGPYYYGEVYDAGMPFVAVSNFDGSGYSAVDFTYLGGAIPVGPANLHLTARAGGSPTMTFVSQLGGIFRTNSGPTPGYAGGEYVTLNAGDVSIEVRYVAIVGG